MPVIKSAIKKLRQDKKREIQNDLKRRSLKSLVNKAKKTPSAKTVQAAFSALDRAVKNNLIHKNKAARTKSSLSKNLEGKGKKTTETKALKPVKKSPTKKPSLKKTKK